MTRKMTFVLLPMALFVTAIAGCGHTTVATGQVTVDGQPLSRGNIVFQPADGNGPSQGAAVTEGRYRVEVAPGAKIVQITGMRKLPYNLKDQQQAAFAKKAAELGDASGTYECVDPTFAKAEGNSSRVEIKLGSQTIDFALKKPPAKRQ